MNKQTTNFIEIIQIAAKQGIPIIRHKSNETNILIQIKKLVAEKRKIRAADKNTYNTNLYHYIKNLNRYDTSLWKPIKIAKKPITSVPPIHKQAERPKTKKN